MNKGGDLTSSVQKRSDTAFGAGSTVSDMAQNTYRKGTQMFDIPAIYDPDNPNNTTTVSQWVRNVQRTLIELQQASIPSDEQLRRAVDPVVRDLRTEFDWVAEAVSRYMDQDTIAVDVTTPHDTVSVSLDDLIQAGTDDRIAFPRDAGEELIRQVVSLFDSPADLDESVKEVIHIVSLAFWRLGWAQGSTYVYEQFAGPEAEPV